MILFTGGFGAVRCSDFKLQLDLDTICIPNERSQPLVAAPNSRSKVEGGRPGRVRYGSRGGKATSFVSEKG